MVPVTGQSGGRLAELYLVSGSGTVTALLESGAVVCRRVVDGEIVGFGGVVVRYTVR